MDYGMIIGHALKIILCVILVVVQRIELASANWLYLALAGFSPPNSVPRQHQNYYPHHTVDRYCSNLPYLNEHQKKICSSHPYAMLSVGFGARDSIVECQSQFSFERWNCTTKQTRNDTAYELFGYTTRSANREAAYLQAMTSAGLVYWITKSCGMGNLTDCSCDASKHSENNRHHSNTPLRVHSANGARVGGIGGQQGPKHTRNRKNDNKNQNPNGNNKFLWGGCSDNVQYGVRFCRDFLDRHERGLYAVDRQVKRLVALHNYEVGRDAIANPSRLRRVCRCHGVSSSCEFRTCWLQMARLPDVGQYLKNLYDRTSVQVARRSKRKLRRKEKSERKIPLRLNELVYAQKSPNYCLADSQTGVYGTSGRECNKTSYGADSCDMLCCGRGHDTRVVTRVERCHCKFVWCCIVKCRNCTMQVDVHTCK